MKKYNVCSNNDFVIVGDFYEVKSLMNIYESSNLELLEGVELDVDEYSIGGVYVDMENKLYFPVNSGTLAVMFYHGMSYVSDVKIPIMGYYKVTIGCHTKVVAASSSSNAIKKMATTFEDVSDDSVKVEKVVWCETIHQYVTNDVNSRIEAGVYDDSELNDSLCENIYTDVFCYDILTKTCNENEAIVKDVDIAIACKNYGWRVERRGNYTWVVSPK